MVIVRENGEENAEKEKSRYPLSPILALKLEVHIGLEEPTAYDEEGSKGVCFRHVRGMPAKFAFSKLNGV